MGIKRLFSFKRKTQLVSGDGQMQLPQTTQSCELYSFETIILDLFWDVYLDFDKNKSKLIISGTSNEESLIEKWSEIQLKHAEFISDDAIRGEEKNFNIARLDAKIKWVFTAVLFLRKDFHKELASKLKSYFKGSGIKLDFSNPFQFQRDLDRCINLAKGWEFELNKMVSVINENKKKQSNKVLSKKDLYSTLAPMSKFMGTQINPLKITLLEYDLNYKFMCESFAAQKEGVNKK